MDDRKAALPVLWKVALGLAVVVVVYYGWRFLSRDVAASPAVLAQQALAAEDPEARQQGAAQLVSAGQAGLEHLRKVSAESDDPAVRAICAQGFGDLDDYESVDQLLEMLEDDTALVRARARGALARLLRLAARFSDEGAEQERAEATRLRETWDRLVRYRLIEPLKEAQALDFFYDQNTDELFEAPGQLVGPIETPSGPFRGQPAGVRAHVFAWEDGSTRSRPFVGWLSLTEASAREHGIAVTANRPVDPEAEDEAAEGGEPPLLIRRPKDVEWVYSSSPEGQNVFDDVLDRRRGTARLKPCLPGME